jgi:hypothetical protein
MAGLATCWPARPVHLALVVPLLLVWSAAAWSVPPAVQARVLALTGPGSARRRSHSAVVPSTSVRRSEPVSAAGPSVPSALGRFRSSPGPVSWPGSPSSDCRDGARHLLLTATRTATTPIYDTGRWPRRCSVWVGTGATMGPVIARQFNYHSSHVAHALRPRPAGHVRARRAHHPRRVEGFPDDHSGRTVATADRRPLGHLR